MGSKFKESGSRQSIQNLFSAGMLLTSYMLNMTVHSIMYSYYFASIYIKDFDKIIGIKKSITIMQMVSGVVFLCHVT